MENHELLSDKLTFEEARALQDKYSQKLKNQKSRLDLKSLKKLKWIAGVDISYFSKENHEYGVSCAVSWDLIENKKKSHAFHVDKIRFPYKAGFLGFRECRLLAHAITKLNEKPDVILCDGHGLIHPRRFGEAVQLGVALDIPTIGIAKNPFIGYFNFKDLTRSKGEKTPVWSSSSSKERELLGYAVCLNFGMKPIFISIGFKINIDLALKIALKTSLNHRQPEPLYLAHRLSKERIK
ncbi:MAG: endonuclease V [Promethearchaeota archaeon]|nr:MAG: endonuclease V [Candidatus Lokiarchaeota archaeon]